MQSIKIHNETNIILTKGNSKAIISTKNGGSITELVLNDKRIINDFSKEIPYINSYASAILFPFANRIENGKYSFCNKEYKLTSNATDNNAIHGLIYNKAFTLKNKNISTNHTQVSLIYKEDKRTTGFPFLFEIELTYTLSKNDLLLNVKVKNIDAVKFPFTIGWHPYFYSEDLKNSFLSIKTKHEIIHNKKMIPVKTSNIKIENPLKINQQSFDNCYILENNKVEFTTPNYKAILSSSFDKNYIQIFTPNLTNHIAIEPITGPSNSFNNQIGLQTLLPNEKFEITWSIQTS